MKTFTTLFFVSAILLTQSARAQYCMLPGRTIYSIYQPGITNFQLNTINRTSSNVEHPLTQPSITVTSDTTTLRRGQTYTVTIKHTRDSTSPYFDTAKNNIRVWIDYNNDKDFDDAGETVISADYKKAGVFTATFIVPATAPIAVVRLRATAKMSSDAGHTIPTPCDMPADPIDYHGEMEDYTLRILSATDVSDLSENTIHAYISPNPANDKIKVLLDSRDNQALNIDLYDITGKQVSNLLHEEKQTASEYNFDLTKYQINSGVYFIRISSATAQSLQKLIIAN